MDYNYYLFRDEYGDIYTNYRSYYNKKRKVENDKVLSKTFFKTMFLCLVLTLIPIICYGIFDVELLLWIACTFLGLTVIFALLSGVYLVKAEDRTYIADFKLTKEYLDQVEQYKLEKSKRYTENLFSVIRKYNEMEEQKKEKELEQKKEKELKPQEIVVKLDEETTKELVNKVDKVITKNIIGTLKIYSEVLQKNKEAKRKKQILKENTTPKKYTDETTNKTLKNKKEGNKK